MWRGCAKAPISDPARALVDIIVAPEVGGAIEHAADCLTNYFSGETPDSELLVRRAGQFCNGALFKRLGFLADARLHDKKLADECRARLTHGCAKLDPALRAKKLPRPWQLWKPETWKAAAS